MKKLYLLLTALCLITSCSDDKEEIFNVQGRWGLVLDLEDGRSFVTAPYASGTDIYSTYTFVDSLTTYMSYHIDGEFGGIPEVDKITCRLYYKVNDREQKIIEEISAINASSIEYDFKGEIDNDNFHNYDKVYIYMEIIVENPNGFVPPQIGFRYNSAGFGNMHN